MYGPVPLFTVISILPDESLKHFKALISVLTNISLVGASIRVSIEVTHVLPSVISRK